MTTRKSFLASASLFAATPALATAATPSPAPPAQPGASKDPYVFDRARFEAMATRSAKHKQCFGATKIAGGGVLDGMQNTIDAYENYLHEGRDTVHAAAVLYHGTSIALAMNDAVWNDLIAAYMPHAMKMISDELTGITFGKGNPFLHSSGSQDVSVESLVSTGCSFFVCHNALVGFSHEMARKLNKPYASVYQETLTGIVPGALVVPAGVWAINALQEAGFTYIAAS